MFLDELPPVDCDMWVVSSSIEAFVRDRIGHQAGGVICFTKGTKILTVDGPRLVEDLGEGDKLQTKDNGVQDILWIGQRRMTGARLHANAAFASGSD